MKREKSQGGMCLPRAQSPTMGTRGFATQQESALYASPVQKTWLKDKKVSFMSTLTQDVRGAAGGLEENKPDQNYTFIHKQAQGAMAVTLLMNKIVQNLAHEVTATLSNFSKDRGATSKLPTENILGRLTPWLCLV